MRPKTIIFFLLLYVITGCASYQPVNKIDGVTSIAAASGGVQIQTAPALRIFDSAPPNGSQTKKVMRPGDRIAFGDGRHFSSNLKFIGTEGDRYKFDVEFMSFPAHGEAETKMSHVAVPAYGEEIQPK